MTETQAGQWAKDSGRSGGRESDQESVSVHQLETGEPSNSERTKLLGVPFGGNADVEKSL